MTNETRIQVKEKVILFDLNGTLLDLKPNTTRFPSAIETDDIYKSIQPELLDLNKQYGNWILRYLAAEADAVRNGDLTVHLKESVTDMLKKLRDGGALIGCFSGGDYNTINLPLKVAGIRQYFQDELIIPAMGQFGLNASKKKQDTWYKLGEYLQSREYSLDSFIDDDEEICQVARYTGIPKRVFHVNPSKLNTRGGIIPIKSLESFCAYI
ncbi:MAG: HAD family hydrolase [archaeon]